jgi:16S rRNA (uracil1498-N3)-methyltransferase
LSRTHHFFVSPGQLDGDQVTLRGDDAHHAARVLRLRTGERITIADGTGLTASATVTAVGDTVEAAVDSRATHDRPLPEITIVQALAKGDAFDSFVDHAVEVGVGRIVPFAAERSVVRWDVSKRERAVERWRAVALAASKRCHAARVAEVDQIHASLDAALDGRERIIVLDPSADARLRETLPATAPATVTLVAGPEGGLTSDELAMAGTAARASLGDLVLRTETAGPAAAALIGFVYGRLG